MVNTLNRISKVKIIIVVVALIAMNSCKKEDTISDVRNNVGHKSNVLFDEALLNDILSHAAVSFDFNSYVEGEEVENEYVVTMDGLHYGVFITNDQTKLAAWITVQEANGKQTGVFEVQGLYIGVSAVIIQQTDFVIITAEEMQYLGSPMSIDEFKNTLEAFIDVAVEVMGCYLVFSVKDGIVRHAIMSANSTSYPYQSWYDRLHGYLEIAKYYPIIDDIDDDDPPTMLQACQNFNKRKDAVRFAKNRMDEEDVVAVSLMKRTLEDGTVVWTVCWERG